VSAGRDGPGRAAAPRPTGINGAGAPLGEWLVGALGLVLLLAAIGFLLWHAMQPSRPPSIELQVDYIAEQRHGYMVRINARNDGTRPVAELQIRGLLFNAAGDSDGDALETAEASLDYLPGGSTRRGVLLFERDPRQHRLRLRAVGYHEP